MQTISKELGNNDYCDLRFIEQAFRNVSRLQNPMAASGSSTTIALKEGYLELLSIVDHPLDLLLRQPALVVGNGDLVLCACVKTTLEN